MPDRRPRQRHSAADRRVRRRLGHRDQQDGMFVASRGHRRTHDPAAVVDPVAPLTEEKPAAEKFASVVRS